MTDNIAIPKRKGKQRLVPAAYDGASSNAGSADYSPVSSTASSTSSPKTPAPVSEAGIGQHSFGSVAKGKEATSPSTPSDNKPKRNHERRVSLLSESLSRSEHTVVNIGDDDRPRLITCVRSSQGFDWNQDIFLPSYMSDHDHQSELERRADPVLDIFVTDEEAAEMYPNWGS